RLAPGALEALVMRPLEAEGALPGALREDGVYVVTGGLGELGLWVAGVLAAKGAIKVRLLGRSALDAGRAAKLEGLRARGAGVAYPAADAADEAALAGVLAGIRERDGALLGVVHCAGIADVDDGGAPSFERARRTLRPKVDGTIALDAATSS